MKRIEAYSEVLRSLREANSLTQEELAEKLLISARVVRDWESGRHFPGPRSCQELCKLYGKKDLVELGLLSAEDTTLKAANLTPVRYRGMMSMLPPTVPVTTQQRELAVRAIYEILIKADTTSVVVTGIRGVGKSTLAALVVAHVKEREYAGNSPFRSEPLWLRVDPAFTIADLMGNVSLFLGKPLPDLSQLTPSSQALMLFRTLDTLDKPLLLVLDQFENVLDYQTGSVLTEDEGIREWLDLMNCQPCCSRILLTSHAWPQGVHKYPSIYMREYHEEGLTIEEGIELLQKQGVNATKEELSLAVEYCSGHAFALVLLAPILRTHHLSLATLLGEPAYFGLWQGNIARNLLSSLYTPRLSQAQSWLLVAFSFYREPVKLEAVQAIMTLFVGTRGGCAEALDVLLTQHLLQAYGEGYYQPHSIVVHYAQDFLREDSEINQRAIKLAAHTEAARYYLQSAADRNTVQMKNHTMQQMHDQLEAIWHLCQAEQWQEAYAFLQSEELFENLLRWGKNVALLEIFQRFLSLARWHPTDMQTAHIYRGLSEIYNNLWQNEKAKDYCEKALKLYKEQKNYEGEIKAISTLGEIYSGLGQNEQAERSFKEALHAYEKTKDVKGEGRMLGNLGWICFAQGERKLALQYYTHALEIYRKISDRRGESNALNGLGLVSNVLKQQQKALGYYIEALPIRREVGDRSGEGRTLNGLGLVYRNLGQRERALDYFEQALSIHKEVGERGGEGRILNNIGLIYADLGQEEQALAYYKQALHICQEIQDRGGESWTLVNVGDLYQQQGLWDRAFHYYGQALEASRSIGDRDGEGDILCSLGTLYSRQRDYTMALTCFLLAKNLLEEIFGKDLDSLQARIENIRKAMDEEQYTTLVEQIEQGTSQLIRRIPTPSGV